MLLQMMRRLGLFASDFTAAAVFRDELGGSRGRTGIKKAPKQTSDTVDPEASTDGRKKRKAATNATPQGATRRSRRVAGLAIDDEAALLDEEGTTKKEDSNVSKWEMSELHAEEERQYLLRFVIIWLPVRCEAGRLANQ